MSSEWPLVRLGDHVDSYLGKMLDAKKNKGQPQPYLGNSNVRWGEFDLVDLAEMRFEATEEERYSLRPGDLVVCEGGEPGRCAIWSGPRGMKIQKALHRIRSMETLDNHYLFYWFCHAAKTGYLDSHFTGTTIKHLTGRAIAALEVPLPLVVTQRTMVDVLKTLDDRIALVRETNATLEAIAQALFKSWIGAADADRLSRHKLQAGDIVFSRRGDVERHALITEREVGWLCGTGCLLLRPGSLWESPGYLSMLLDAPRARTWLVQHAVGATMPNLNTGILGSLPVVLPSTSVLRAFEELLTVTEQQRSRNASMSETLATLRDTLLPRLISGQLRLPEAMTEAREATT